MFQIQKEELLGSFMALSLESRTEGTTWTIDAKKSAPHRKISSRLGKDQCHQGDIFGKHILRGQRSCIP